MKNQSPSVVLVAAHRGNAICCPENTLPSFESALKLPVDMLEIDLHMAKDGEIVLMHDHTVDRTTDGSGLVRDMALAELKRLDAGQWKGNGFAGTRVPTFVEFLELAAGRPDIQFNIELKDYPRDGACWAYESASKAIELMERYGISQRSVINSWSGELLEYIDEKYGHRYRLHGYYPLSLMGENQARDPYTYLYCICLFGTREAPVAAKEAFDCASARGVQPWVYYPIDEEEIIEESIARGARLITTNDPAKVLRILRGKGLHP